VHIKNSFLLTLLLFSACSLNSKPTPYLLQTRSSSCQEEIKQVVSTLVHAQNLTISEDVFSKDSSLYLTNKRDGALISSPIVNDLGGRKTLLLYKKNNSLHIGLLNRKKEIVESKKLLVCR